MIAKKESVPEFFSPGIEDKDGGLFDIFLARKGLTMTDKLLYGAMLQISFVEGACWCSVSSLAKRIGTPERTVVRSISHLKKEGLIRVVLEPKNPGEYPMNHYSFLKHPMFKEIFDEI